MPYSRVPSQVPQEDNSSSCLDYGQSHRTTEICRLIEAAEDYQALDKIESRIASNIRMSRGKERDIVASAMREHVYPAIREKEAELAQEQRLYRRKLVSSLVGNSQVLRVIDGKKAA